MNDDWQPTNRPEETSPGPPKSESVTPGALTPPASSPGQPAGTFGPAIALPATGAHPGAVYPQPELASALPPTGPTLAVGAPTPPSGMWNPPAGSGWTPGPAAGTPAGGAWGGPVPPGAVPPGGGWAVPGFPPPPAQPAPHKKRTGLVVGVASAIVVASVLAGAGLGHTVWPSDNTSQSAAAPSSGASGSSGSSGASGSSGSFGGSGSSGSSGSGLSPFGGSSSSGSSGGNSSTGAGAPSNITAIAAKVSPALVDINTNLSYEDEQAAGTGMVLTSNGEILTNNHVIDGATSISVTDVGNGKTYSATVVGYDRTEDVAVIKLVNASGLQTVTAASGTAAVGQAVVGVGNAGGTGGTPSSAGGSVTALDQSITASDDSGGNSENLTGLIETDAGIEPGDSGGSLVNTSGQVIGMDTAASTSSGYESTSGTQAYAIPIAMALSLAKQIEEGNGSSTVHIGPTAFLGVSVQSTGSSSSGGDGGGFSFGGGNGAGSGSSDGGSGTTTSGATVAGTVSGSVAAQAGVATGDTITAVDGKTIASPTDLSNSLESEHPGDTVQLTWTDTSGQSHTANVKLASGPPA